jgi:hypothetical protein
MTKTLKFDPKREERIRTRAYHLWESEGRPHGRAAEFWERAAELVLMEEAGVTGQLPNPQVQAGKIPARRIIDEADIQENLGEFPGQLKDQSDAEPTPRARKGRKKAKATDAQTA